MVLAHAAEASGPHAELLVAAAAFLILGVTLYAQKSVKPVVIVVLLVIALALASGAFAT